MFILNKLTLLFILLFTSGFTTAAEFTISINTPSLKAVKDAVVTLTPSKKIALTNNKTYIIDQINKTYVPHVKIIPVGSSISFPNKDNIRHHVYSFSDAKKFELPLYEGTPSTPILFDKSGIVTLGCNIHDWMSAYIFISDTPYYGLSNATGSLTIKNLPAGKYSIKVWHPRIKEEIKPTDMILSGQDKLTKDITISLKPAFKIRRAPKAQRRRY
jgi:plastocyanin